MSGVNLDFLPEHWRNRAEEARSLARKMKDPLFKREMEAIAQGYNRLALHAEKRWRQRELQK